MTRAAAAAMARVAKTRGLDEAAILPLTDDIEVAADIATATGMAAQQEGVAKLSCGHDRLRDLALEQILAARGATSTLTNAGFIPSTAQVEAAGT